MSTAEFHFDSQSRALQQMLEACDIQDTERATANLMAIAHSGITADLLASLWQQLCRYLPESHDPDMALNNLDKFIVAARSPLALAALLDRDPTGLPILLRIFSASQYLSDQLIRDTESYDYLRMTEGQLYPRSILVDELCAEIRSAADPAGAMQILRRFKHRETLRIAFGDLIVHHRIEQVAQQISLVAEAITHAALQFAARHLHPVYGQPRLNDGLPCRFVVLAMGKLGGGELNYSSDIDLVFVYEADGTTETGKENRKYFEKLTRDTSKLLNDTTPLGAAYRVDLRLRPEGSKGRICNSVAGMLRYYDLQGRTWERQALIKARPVAGDLHLGHELLQQLQPWIYRNMLNQQDITGIQALKRQIERRATAAGEEHTNVKTGHGGIRDIEFVIQFLQLLHGGGRLDVKSPNTFEAIRKLQQAGCLSLQESQLLLQNYSWLRKVEHRLQIMFDLQTHTLPESEIELGKLARRMNYSEYFGRSALDQFQADLQEITSVNRKILDHLLHLGFGAGDSENGSADETAPEVDLILDPDPPTEMVQQTLSKFRIQDASAALGHLQNLAAETTVFLSSRRCRHFLASIISELLTEIQTTPDPDATLRTLSSVADSIGAKAELWELFRFNKPSMQLFVRLCASSDYLTDILRRSPGMIDDLLDSLLMESLPNLEWLRKNLKSLLRGADDPDPIIHSFKKAHHLRVGIRDIMGRDPIQQTHRELSDIAQVCLESVTDICYLDCSRKYTEVFHQNDDLMVDNGLAILGLGKIGSREPNYHSDIDVIFLYDQEYQTQISRTTSDQHFYSEVAARVTRKITYAGPQGRLYEMDSRLRPTGRSGSLAVSFAEFARYFASGSGQLWERLALCKARPIYGKRDLERRADDLVYQAITIKPWDPNNAAELRQMRLRMQEDCSPANLKRGVGGTVDIEFVVQMLQLQHAAKDRELLVPGTVDSIGILQKHQLLHESDARAMRGNYQLLRNVEARLRLMNTTARHDLPADELELEKLAFLLRCDQVAEMVQNIERARAENREIFNRLFNNATRG